MSRPIPNIVILGLEWRRLRSDRIFWIVLALCSLVLWYGLANGAGWMRFQQETILRANIIAAEGIAAAKAKAANIDPAKEIDLFEDPRSAMAFESEYLRLSDCLPPTPLAIVAIGQSDLLPICVRVTTNPWPVFLASYEWQNPLHLLLGRFDCTFAITYIAPLLVLMVSFNIFSREAELGTLPLLLSYPMSPTRWLGLCYALRSGLFLGTALVTLAIGFAAVGFDLFATGALFRLSLFLAATAAYLSFWFALAWLVNAARGGSATNALTLAACWLVLVVLLPSCLNLAVKQIYPMPSRIEFINALRNETEVSSKKAGDLLKSYRQDHPDIFAGDENNFVAALIAVNAETEHLLKPIKQHFREQKDHQAAAIERFGFLSPAILVQGEITAVAGTDLLRHQRFMEAVESHRLEVASFFNPKFVSEAPFKAFDDVPPFDFAEATAGSLAWDIAGKCLIMLAAGFTFVILGTILLRGPILERSRMIRSRVADLEI